MDKLIELLETFEKENVEKLKSDVWENDTISPRVWSKSDITIYNKLQVISKEFWFIKWLVDNDKIYSWDIALTVYNLDLRAGKHTYTEYPIYESLLMLLAIQDNPIEFLISILK